MKRKELQKNKSLPHIPRLRLPLSVFIAGACVMVYELIGSRILAPYLGSSIYVWTSLIGVILGSLSLGYWLGGKLADYKATYSNYGLILFFSSCLVLLTAIIKDYTIAMLANTNMSLEIRTLIITIIIFSPASMMLGFISPYAVKLQLKELKNSGSMVGKLYAISTLGSIFGTFFSGFYLIPNFGINNVLLILCLVLILSSVTFLTNKLFLLAHIFLTIIIILLLNKNPFSFKPQGTVFDIDTKYSRFLGIIGTEKQTNKKVLFLTDILNTAQSAIYLESDELVSKYLNFFELSKSIRVGAKRALIIGGGAYSYPNFFVQKYPDSTIDVIEIDPDLTKLAQKYFKLKANTRMKIINEDGRVFLNKNNKKYNMVFLDAFKSNSNIPMQLTTLESVNKIFSSLDGKGIVFVNIVSPYDNGKNKFLSSELLTYKKVFPEVHLYRLDKNETGVQNFILLALKDKEMYQKMDSSLKESLLSQEIFPPENDAIILTDDFAPVEYYAKTTL